MSQARIKNDGPSKVIFRLVEVKNEVLMQGIFTYPRKEETRNFVLTDLGMVAERLCLESFYYAHLITEEKEGHLMIYRRNFITLKWKLIPRKADPDQSHDKAKNYSVDATAPWLHLLGITSVSGHVLGEMQKKFRQINKYTEIFESHLAEFRGRNSIRLMDMGCGKGYLTFAMYDSLQKAGVREITVTGVDNRSDLMAQNNRIAQKLGYDRLNFIAGDILQTELIHPDILIALHACDTATDDALWYGIRQKTPLIFVAPCCQKQVRRDSSPSVLTGGLFRFGIIKERMTSDLTDVIRANILRYAGYKVKMLEFIGLEHTPKNVLITAAYSGKKNPEALAEIYSWMELFGIKEHYLLKRIMETN